MEFLLLENPWQEDNSQFLSTCNHWCRSEMILSTLVVEILTESVFTVIGTSEEKEQWNE